MFKILLVSCIAGNMEYDDQGIAYICQYLRDRGYLVSLISCADIKEFKDKVLDIENYAIIGFNTYHNSINLVDEIIKLIKKHNPNLLICLGGYTATYYYEELMDRNILIDFIIRGEGEKAFFDLCQAIELNHQYSEIGSLVYRDGFSIIVNKEAPLIELISKSAKDLLPEISYHQARISSSRGCLGDCSFCYSHHFFDNSGKTKWRGRDPQNVVSEMVNVYQKFGIDRFFFDDASFEDSLQGSKRMLEICDLIEKSDVPISFSANFRATIYKKLNKIEISKVRDGGLSGAFLGIEAANEQDLKLYCKGNTLIDNQKVINFFKENDVGVEIGFINLNPYTTYDRLLNNAEFLYENMLMGTMNISNKLCAYKGTRIYSKITKDKFFRETSNIDGYHYNYENDEIALFDDYIQSLMIKIEPLRRPMYFNYMVYPQTISHYKLISKKIGLKIDDSIEEFNAQYKKHINNHNKICYEWYMGLLSLLKTGWDNKKAMIITNDSSLVNESKSFINQINLVKAKLNKSIRKKYIYFPLSDA